jgi:nucleotide-binding universal stress UspA family protein
MIALTNILVPTDFDQTSQHALDYARELARQFGATLHLLHVVDDVFSLSAGTEGSLSAVPRLQRELEEHARREVEKAAAGTPAKVEVLTASSPAAAIVAYARANAIDLIVMGTHGRGGTPAALIGSVAERVVRTAACPVLTVRHPDHRAAGDGSQSARAAAR